MKKQSETKSTAPQTEQNGAASNSSAASFRRLARETALRALYTVDVGKQSVDEVVEEGIAASEMDPKSAEFTRTLVSGTISSLKKIDAEIDKHAVGFPVARQTAVDRNILRLAAAEILFHASDAPMGAVVNEAVELAKKYSTSESGKFVNGVLGALVREAEEKAAPSAKGSDEEVNPSEGTSAGE